jgi:hypothetical protein
MVADSIKLDGLYYVDPKKEVEAYDLYNMRKSMMDTEQTLRAIIMEINNMKTEMALLKSKIEQGQGGRRDSNG